MWILNAHVPLSLLSSDWYSRYQSYLDQSRILVSDVLTQTLDLVKVHLKIEPQKIDRTSGLQTLIPSDPKLDRYAYSEIYFADFPPHPLANLESGEEVVIDQKGGLLLPCFVDIHTHLDKGHIWQRSPNRTGTFATALQTVSQDAEQYWTETDIYVRMNFALQCSYAHGTQALRTHLDSSGEVGKRVWKVFQQIKKEWSDRLELQAVALVPPHYYGMDEADDLVDLVAESQGILGGVFFSDPHLDIDLDRLFTIANDRHLSIDLHVDESNNPHDRALLAVAQAKLRHNFQQSVICGHCCSLSLQSKQNLAKTIAAVKEAEIGIVSLPLCNLYLQDRQPDRTPQWRGITALHELKAANIPIAIASDNCRDPFYAFGDHDALEVLRESTRIAHLDHPYGDWIKTITSTPGEWFSRVENHTSNKNIPTQNTIAAQLPADFILFEGRNWNEVLSRPENNRRIFRNAQEISIVLPHYSELDRIC